MHWKSSDCNKKYFRVMGRDLFDWVLFGLLNVKLNSHGFVMSQAVHNFFSKIVEK